MKMWSRLQCSNRSSGRKREAVKTAINRSRTQPELGAPIGRQNRPLFEVPGGRFRGQVTLRTAFANSINSVAVQLAEAVGIPAIIDTAKKLGVQSELPAVPSLALGSTFTR